MLTMVASITVNMSVALIPSAPQQQFAALDRPFGLWIGAEDELFLPDKVLAFAELAVSVRSESQAMCIPEAKHLSILINAHKTMGPWIGSRISGREGPLHD
jgi:acylglycerol lipase